MDELIRESWAGGHPAIKKVMVRGLEK